eukprot:TRINITY_DN3038_c0_g3_i1.p1 TRINITY_DN3038_c0_g3~~TRINITY_DN3038_c0_g3_i1.p1  ORF type:complete len:453 (+),score=87.58 TRINITY_DN3038_c0_g3_i1:112-1470(+)
MLDITGSQKNNSSQRDLYKSAPLSEVSRPSEAPPSPPQTVAFGALTIVVELAFLGVFWAARLDLSDSSSTDSSSIYNFYVGVALMMFVGFGYLMTFLKAYGLGAVGFTMLITCVGVQWAIILESVMAKGEVSIDFMSLLNGNFAVAAVLISFGGLIGKISPLQVLLVTLLELPVYVANKVYFLKQYDVPPLILDCGGTIIIHVFGAYFGLAACQVLGPPAKDKLNASSYQSDLFSLIGTVFLWLFWPSFVAGGLPGGPQQTSALINTVLALLASTVMTFGLSQILQGGKIGTVPIQNATLAGGVSIGAAANLVGPFGAGVIGALAGTLSTWGFVTGPLFSNVDTCGIHNLHGMPGLLGGVFSVMVPFFYSSSGIVQLNQLLGLGGTLLIAVVSGAICGFLLKVVDNFVNDSASSMAAKMGMDPADFKAEPFSDAAYWECAEDIPRSAPMIQL